MAEDEYDEEPVEDDADEKKEPRDARYWHRQLKAYHRDIEDRWSTQRDNIDRLYAKERSDSADREYSIFWANIEVLRPAVYARAPVPVVVPRFKTQDQVKSQASEIVERCLVTTFEQSEIDQALRWVRDEFLRYGRGIARARLDEGPKVVFDEFCASDFAHDPARKWSDVKWVAFRAWMDKESGRERFGKAFDRVPTKRRADDYEKNTTYDEDPETPVWEIWCKDTGLVHFVNEEYEEELDTVEPWVKLESFWPCPRPAYGTVKPNELFPVPDIRQYKDQIEEINTYTARIAALSESLRMRGFYPAGESSLSDAIETAMRSADNRAELVPISSYAGLGGATLRDSIVWLPVDQVLLTVKGLVELRRIVIDDVYQITGISDIVRGQTEASETATAQNLKSQWGSIRIRERQQEIQRFACDLGRIGGEIIAENFDQQTLAQMSQVELPSMQDKMMAQFAMSQAQAGFGSPPPPQAMEMLQKPSWEEVIAFLRDDRTRGFSIEIETDSTIQPDEDADKNRRIEFVQALGQLLQTAVPIAQVMPPMVPFLGEVLKFVAQGFRAGRPLEGAIETLVQQMSVIAQQQAQQAQQPPPPDPKVEAEARMAQLRLEGERVNTQGTIVKAQGDIAVAQNKVKVDEARTQLQLVKNASAKQNGGE